MTKVKGWDIPTLIFNFTYRNDIYYKFRAHTVLCILNIDICYWGSLNVHLVLQSMQNIQFQPC